MFVQTTSIIMFHYNNNRVTKLHVSSFGLRQKSKNQKISILSWKKNRCILSLVSMCILPTLYSLAKIRPALLV